MSPSISIYLQDQSDGKYKSLYNFYPAIASGKNDTSFNLSKHAKLITKYMMNILLTIVISGANAY